MRRSPSISRHLIALALVTIFFSNSLVLSVSALGRPASATLNLQPTPPPPPTPVNGKIAFSRVDSNYTLNGVYLIDPDGSNEVKVPFTEFDSTPVWSPNGQRLAVVRLANSHPGNVSGWGVEIMDTDGSNRVRLNDNVEPYERIAWSPDGTKIAYTSYGQLGANADIMVMDADTGANLVNLTNDPGYDYLPSWSPDGTKIVFTSNRNGGTMDVFVMNADGSNQQNITNYFANDYHPAWSPDGSKIVFVSSGRGGTFDNDEICVMNPDGTNVVNLTLNQVPDLMPAWSPDGTKIVFSSNRNGNRDLYTIAPNGSNETRVTVHTAEDSRASWQQVTVSPTPTPTPTPIETPTPTPTPAPTPDECNTQNTITMLPPKCGAGLVQTPTVTGGLFEKTQAERGVHSFQGVMSKEAMLGDGALQFFLPQGGTASVGLTETEPWCGDSTVDYLLHVNPNYNASPGGYGIYTIREWDSPGTNVNSGFFDPQQPPILFRIERQGDTVTYFANGVVYAVSNKHSTAPLHAYVLLYAPNTQVEVTQFTAVGGLKVRSNVPQLQDVTWQNPINVTVNGNSITKTSGASEGYDAGASSVQQVTQDNSFYRFKAADTQNNFLAALALNDQNASFPAGYLLLYFSYGTLYDWVSGLGANLGSFDGNSEFEVAIDNGALVYYRRDPATGARTPMTGSGTKIKFPFLFDTSLRAMGSGVRDVMFGQYPFVNPCDVNPGPTPTPTPTATPTPAPTPAPVYNGRIAFVSTRAAGIDIYTMRPDGSEQTRITSDPADEGDPAWSPDGTKIAFSSNRDDTSGLGESAIYVMNADGTNQTRLTDVSLFTSSPSFSPDGTKIAFQKGYPNSFNGYDIHIYVMNADGTNRVELTPGTNIDGMEPTWSPDGSKIAFRSARSFANEIWLMNADGSNPVNLTNNNGSNFYPAWSPDGTKIAYSNYLDGNTDIFVMNADGSNQTRVTNDASNEHAPAWSPDGTKITYFSDLGVYPLHDVYVINADGSGRTQLTTDPENDLVPAWQPLSEPLPPPAPQADLSAFADAQPYQVEPGGALVFFNAVTNNGPSLANNVTADVYVPPGTQLDGYSAPGGACQTTTYPNDAGHQVLCSFGDVGPSETRSVTVNVTITAIDGASMQAINTVSSSTADPNANNNVAYAPLIVRAATPPAADLAATAGLNLLAANGATVTHNVSVSNYGTDAAEYVTLTIQLPPGATYDTATNPYGLCTPRAPDAQGTIVDCTVGDIPAYESRLISHTATVTGAPYEVLTFTSTVSSDTADPYLDSNVSSVSVQIEGPPVPTPTPATGANALLAFETRRDGNSEIYSRRADGSAQVNLTNDPADDDGFGWSPDGSKLAFSRLVDAGSNNRKLFVMNADGSNLMRLTNSPDDQDSAPVWSPDGTKLLFTSMSNQSQTRALWVTNVDGSSQVRIGVAAYDYDNDPTWSPDGTKIAYARDYYDGMNPTERNIYTANADGSNRTRIANGPGESDFSPAWSADGTKINFVREVAGAVDIYDMDVDGSNQRNLTNLGNVYGYPVPSRSADRSKIAFVTGISNTPTVYVMNADGSSLVSVFNTAYNVATLRWSPDATKLAVGTNFNTGLGAGIYVVNADGSGSLHFGGDAEYNQDPDWSPDGTRIAFTTRRTGNNGIDIINADGTGRVDLTNDPAYYRHPKWQPAPQGNTPAGTNVTVTENGATVTFSNVTTAGQTTITPIDPNSLSGVPGEYVINANSLAFEITTTAVYSGPITIGFQVPGVNNPITFSTLRVLHGEPPPVPNFVDRTILAPDSPTHDFPARTVYARVTSLSPFIILERRDTIPPSITITSPTPTVYLLNQVVAAAFQCTDAGSGVATCTGPVANGAAIDTASVGAKTFTVNATDVAGNTSQQSVNYTVTYGVNPLFDQTKAHKSGSTIPIKLQLVNASGVNQSASNIVVTATAVTQLSNNAPGALQDSGNSNPDFNFRYTGGQYHFNLKTTGYATGTYRLDFQVSGDPVTHSVQFQIK